MVSPADAPQADVLIVTATRVESKAVIAAFAKLTGQSANSVRVGRRVYRDLGEVNGTRVFLALTEMGSGGLGASQQAVQKGIDALRPSAVLLVGIAFGVDEKKQRIGEILVSRQLQLYDLQRVGKDQMVLRGDKPHASAQLIDHFRHAELDWDDSKAKVDFDLILSGEKLVDNHDYREQLKRLAPEAIGGEMEGAGLYVACQDAQVDWIVIKAICDWADGHKKRNKTARQQLAADNAAAFVAHALQQAPLKRPESPMEQPPTTINNTGSGATATQGGVAIRGNMHGNIYITTSSNSPKASEFLSTNTYLNEIGNTTLGKGDMQNIPSNIFSSLRRILLQCGPFETNQQLRAVFAHPLLQPWQVGLPQTESVADRVDLLINYLMNAKRNTGEYILPIFLWISAERIDPQNTCHRLLSDLAKALGYSHTPRTMDVEQCRPVDDHANPDDAQLGRSQRVSKDFFISYNGADYQWAEWIAWQLEKAGYSTVIQAWDFRPGSNFVLEMQNAAEQADRTIAVLSPSYIKALYTHPEWAAAFARDPTGSKRKLLPVRVRPCELTGLLSQIVYIDLVGLRAEEACDKLFKGVDFNRSKPGIAPGFPGLV